VRRAYLGLAGGPRPLPPRIAARSGRSSAVEVVEVVEGSPAALAGLRAEDLILTLDGAEVSGVEDIQRLLTADRIGETVVATIIRRGRELEVPLVPTELEDVGS
jgi:S1-C subfamily serine protease